MSSDVVREEFVARELRGAHIPLAAASSNKRVKKYTPRGAGKVQIQRFTITAEQLAALNEMFPELTPTMAVREYLKVMIVPVSSLKGD